VPVADPKSKSASKKKGAKGGKRTASDAFADSPAPASTNTKKRGRKSNGAADDVPETSRELPVGSWEDHITRVTSIMEEAIPEKAGGKGREKTSKQLTGLIEWNDNGPKTQHKLKVLRQKCPQKLLDYYEQHL